MKAILCLAMVIWSVSNALAQPMLVEWSADIPVTSDTLDALRSSSVLSDDGSGAIYLCGKAWGNNFSGGNDSSDAFAAKFSGNGDSLWFYLYDSYTEYLEEFGQLALYPNGSLALGSYYFSVYNLSPTGQVIGRVTHACEDAYHTGVEAIATAPDGRLLTGSRCVTFSPLSEAAVVTCFGANGDSLWSITRQYRLYTYVEKILPQDDGAVIVHIFAYNPSWVDYILHIDEFGNVLNETRYDERIRDISLFSQDTLLIAFAVPDGLMFSKRTIDNVVIDERTYQVAGSWDLAIFCVTRNIIRVVNRDYMIELSGNLDSLWAQDFDVYYDDYCITQDGGLAVTHSIYGDDGFEALRLTKYAAPYSRVVPSTGRLDFGETMPGVPLVGSLGLINIGLDDVQISQMTLSDPFGINIETPFSIPPNGETLYVDITFSPTEAIEYTGTLVIDTDTPFDPIEVELFGSAIPDNAEEDVIAAQYHLSPAFPNPFNPTTTLSFSVAHDADVQLNVFDVNGRLVSKVVQGKFTAGQHIVNWSCAECASGIYFVTMNAGTFSASQKLLLLK